MLNISWGLIQFLWVWSIGVFLLKQLPVHIPKRYWLAVAFLLGESVVSLFLLAMGLCSLLKPSIILPIVSISAFFTALSFWDEMKPSLQRLPKIVKESPLSAALLMGLLIPYLLGVCVPEREIDSIWYHLYVPQYYLNHGGAIQNVPFNLPSHYPMYAHLHYVITLMLGNDMSAKVFTLLHFIPLLMGLAAGVKRYAGKQWMMPACVFMLACVHYKLPVMANIYRPLQLSLLLSTLLLLYSYESGRKSAFYLAAFFCGMAIGTKYPAIFFVFAAHIAFMVFRWALRKRTSTFILVQSIAIYSLIAWTLASPWLIKSFLYTGNPFFPGLSGLFSVKPEYQAVVEIYSNIHSLAPLKANGFMDWASIVYQNAIWTMDNDDVLFGLGLLSIVLVPVFRRQRGFHPVLAALGLFLFFPLLWGHAVVRLFSICYPVLVLSTVTGLRGLTQRIKRPQLLTAVIMLAVSSSFVINKLTYFSSPTSIWRGEICISESARREWLDQYTIMPRELFAMKDWMDKRLMPDEKVYSFNSEYPYYLNRQVYFSDGLFGEQLILWLKKEPDEAARQLRLLGIGWFLDGEKNYNFPPEPLKDAWQQFRNSHLSEEHREGDVVLYRFNG